MEIRNLQLDDVPAMWQINEEGLPGTGEISINALSNLLNISEYAIGAFDSSRLLGFVICLSPGKEYESLNYSWFNEKFKNFLYVDRIAISEKERNNGIGSKLYKLVFAKADSNNLPITAEVSLKPPNTASDRFHKRHGFMEIGIVHHEKKSVTMYIRDVRD